jgi:hypothetical protein
VKGNEYVANTSIDHISISNLRRIICNTYWGHRYTRGIGFTRCESDNILDYSSGCHIDRGHLRSDVDIFYRIFP